MKFGIIGTWAFSYEGIKKAYLMYKRNEKQDDCLEAAICDVEDNPNYKTVGYGGLPNIDGEVELDGAFMDGDTLAFGAVAGIKNHKNIIGITRKLSENELSCFLVGDGATKYAERNGFPKVDLLTVYSKQRHLQKLQEMNFEHEGHDTVGMVSLQGNRMICGVSTSGMFMKSSGRCGDSPLIGNGFYVDSDIGGATATGTGEDINKGSICRHTVRLMEQGFSPMEAAEIAVNELNDLLVRKRGKAGDISVVCMNKDGEYGAATNTKDFSFVVARDDIEPTVFRCINEEGFNRIFLADDNWIKQFYLREANM